MSEIQRWGISYIHQEEFKSDTGRYVLYTDHLDALAEKERDIATYKDICTESDKDRAKMREQIAALQAQSNKDASLYNKNVGELIEKIDALTAEDVWTFCHFQGPVPEGYTYWSDFCASKTKTKAAICSVKTWDALQNEANKNMEELCEARGKVTPLIDKAADFIGCPDDLKSLACIDVALNHANKLREELREERERIRELEAELEATQRELDRARGSKAALRKE
jgi:DNA repair exonuclease SbcCD ATPase subunit